jgi:uncharacterized protein YwqG
MRLTIPDELKKYEESIVKSMVTIVKIDCKNQTVLPWESKIGGNPYWELSDEEYPKDEEGKPMRLLAQINFHEVPAFHNYPREGLLQFFVSTVEDEYGINFDDLTSQTNFRVIFRKSIKKDKVKLLRDFSFLDVVTFDHFPITGEQKLEFRIDEEVVPSFVEEFHVFFPNIDMTDEESKKYKSEINPKVQGCKMGGYPDFKQNDPRGYDDEILLLQLGYENQNNIMWGDLGVGSFFIRRDALSRLDFSEVAYYWDCY